MLLNTINSLRKISWIIVILFCVSIRGYAQQTPAAKYVIEGKIIDSLSGKPVAYATIIFSDKSNNEIASTYSTESGLFKTAIAQIGIFKVEISSVDYLAREINISVDGGKNMILLPPVYLTAVAKSLDGVILNARKKLIEQKPGMLVYNAENDLTNKGGTGADVLRKAPVLNVDAQGNVTMRGSGNIKILVNGKYSGQVARSPADALNMMPADMIKAVEVITTPSAKYDAEGAAGVINIITKKGRKDMSGSLEAVASNWEQAFNPRFSITKDKWNINFNGHLHRLKSKSEASLHRSTLQNSLPSQQLEQEILTENVAPHGSGDLNIVFTPDSVSELTLGINAWFGNWPENYKLSTIVSVPAGGIIEQYNQAVAARSRYLGSDINIGYNRKLKKPGREITLLVQTSPSRDIYRYNAIQSNNNNELLYRELNNNQVNNLEWTVQGDYIHPLSSNGKHIFETGLKMIYRNVDNKYNVETSHPQNPEELIPEIARSDNFKYKQNVLAGYAMFKFNIKNNWYLEAGARLEQTFIEGKFVALATDFKNEFTNFVPTATISKKFDEKQTISLSYTKRLTRPYIWDLNPNPNLSDPKNIVTGNPQLQPEIAHQAELVYGINASAGFFGNASIFWKQTGNAMIDFTRVDNNGISTTSKQNLAANRQYGLNLSSTAVPFSKWTINGNLNINYLDFSSKALQVLSAGWAAEINLNTTYKLPRDYAMQAFGEYNTRSVTLQGFTTSRYHYSFAARKTFEVKKINVTFAIVNPFSKIIRQTDVMNATDFTSRTDNRYFNRAFKLTLSWEFGRMFEPKERKKITNDDVKDQGKG